MREALFSGLFIPENNPGLSVRFRLKIHKAEETGCEIVKLFPGELYGPSFVRAIRGPQPWTSIMPTGGVRTEEANLNAWFNAGVTCVGIGSKLISREILANKDVVRLERTLRETLGVIK